MRVLICFDGSESAAHAVQLVVGRAWPEKSFFKLFSVRGTLDGRNFQELALEPLQKRFGAQFVTAEERTAGHVGEAILHVASQWYADLIAMGSRDRVGLTRLVLGSVSDFVLRRAHCSVLVARETNHSFFLPASEKSFANAMKILICIDDFEDSLAAVNYLVSSAWPDGTEFIVLKVMEHGLQDFSLGVTLPWVSVPYEGDIAEGKAIVSAANVVGHVSAVLEERFPNCEITELIQEGFPALRILAVAREHHADLIVMGAKGRSDDGAPREMDFPKHRLGSIAAAVAEEAPCSVQIVRCSP